jgi:hypothetical protein
MNKRQMVILKKLLDNPKHKLVLEESPKKGPIHYVTSWDGSIVSQDDVEGSALYDFLWFAYPVRGNSYCVASPDLRKFIKHIQEAK